MRQARFQPLFVPAVLASLLAGGCILPGDPGARRIFQSSWRLDNEISEGEETLVATWTVPGRVKLGHRLLQASGRLRGADENTLLPQEVVVRVEIQNIDTGQTRKRYRLIVDRSPEDGFRKSKRFPKSVAQDSLVTVSVEPLGSALAAGTGITLCIDLVRKRNQLDEFPSCAVGTAATTLSGIQLSVFSGRCATSGCHDSITAANGLNLEGGRSFANLIDVPVTQSPGELRVRPGDSERSYLVRKLRGTNNIGGRMPLGGPFLADEEIAGVAEWIAQGARDN
ncbi:MAG: c-type cytochrome [Thermoanaerobaculia bacterium]